MSKVEFKLNRSGVAELMKSGNMQDVLRKHATSIKNRAGAGYEQDMHVGRNRANAMVWAGTYQVRAENLRNNTLLKAMK